MTNDELKKRIARFEKAAKKFGTDKLMHGYMPHYAKHLPMKPKRFLEIGCWKGDSLRMWRELFPDTELHTLDLFGEHQPPTDIPGLICHKGSQSDHAVLSAILRQAQDDGKAPGEIASPRSSSRNDGFLFDVIIDDGSHNTIDQNTTLNFLLPFSELYIVEDLHCCNEKFYRNGIPFEESILGRIKGGKFPHRHELHDDKIVFIHAA